MRTQGFSLLACAILTGAIQADDNDAARALVDAAIRAHGGEEALAKYPVVYVKTESIFQGYKSTPVFFHTSEVTTHGGDQFRVSLSGKLFKKEFHVVNVLDGKVGWVRQGGEGKQDTRECSPAQVADFQESGYFNRVTTLVPIKGREFTLSLAGEQKHHDRALAGVRVSCRGHRDVTLYFDKQTHLLIKTEERGKAGTDVEGKVETIRGRYKEVQGVQMPTSWEVFYNDQCLWSHIVIEYKLVEKPAPGVFAKP